jgi:hypothetical protein
LRQKQDKRKAARGKAASSFGLFDHRPRLPAGLPTPTIMQDYLDKVAQYEERSRQHAMRRTPEERFAACVEQLRARGVKKAVDIASSDFGIEPRTGYRCLARLEKQKR